MRAEREDRAERRGEERTRRREEKLAHMGPWLRFKTRAIWRIRREMRVMGLLDEQHGISPFGFKNKELEQKFMQFFFVTFAQNHKTVTFWIYFIATIAHSLASIRYIFDEPKSYICIVTSVIRAILCALTAYHFARPHLSAFSKSFYNALTFVVHRFFPGAHCIEAFGIGASRTNLMFETVLISTIFPFFNPDYRTSQSGTVLVCWTPVIMQVGVHQAVSHLEDAVQWICLALVCNGAGAIWGAWLGVDRRRKYLASLPVGRRRSLRSSSSSPSRHRSPSPSSRGPGPSLASETRRRRSPSPSGGHERPAFGRGRVEVHPAAVGLDEAERREREERSASLPPLCEAGSEDSADRERREPDSEDSDGGRDPRHHQVRHELGRGASGGLRGGGLRQRAPHQPARVVEAAAAGTEAQGEANGSGRSPRPGERA